MTSYLGSTKKQFEYIKSLAEGAMDQLPDEALFYRADDSQNSIAVLVKHLVGNMLSRWTDFLNTDGEKVWRNRDAEFKILPVNRSELMSHWNRGWDCLFNALDSLKKEDLNKIVYIRNMGHTVIEAINRQLSHYSYHVGQIVLLAKQEKKRDWTSLSIAPGKSNAYNAEKFTKEKQIKLFTEDL